MSLDLFDVIAKAPDGTTGANARLMLRSLLADRFGLVVRNETRPVPRYVLSIGKGSKLKAASSDAPGSCRPTQQPGGGPPGDLASMPNIKVACRNLTAAAIAENLHQMAGGYLDHDVVDQTKLDGSWDFDIEWTPRGALEAKGHDGISIFDAVDKQLAALALASARFEAATIKPADPNGRPFQGLLYQGGSTMHAGGTLRFMIAIALQVSPNIAEDMVAGLPKSADSQRWDSPSRRR